MKDIVIDLFGTYTPVETTTVLADGTTVTEVASGMAGVDWPWVIGALAFLLCLYCFFRILGGIFRR